MELTIRVIGNHPALQLAKKELERCLALATGEEISASEKELLTLSIDDAISKGDDAYRIDADWNGAANAIVGSNPRSVLFGVYRLLDILGFRWIRPGKEGELVPKLSADSLPAIHLADQASYPFRTICIEGAISKENVLEMLEWMSRHGMNGYFIQFRLATVFFERWYEHHENPFLQKEDYDIVEINQAIRGEMARRGMEYQAVGHGWTCEPLGIEGEGWNSKYSDVPEKTKKYFAMINGRREIFHSPVQTNLCYSNSDVQELLANAVLEYARENPQVDIIHFWLSDDSNNSCECEKCRVRRLSDWYVEVCNRIDEKLTDAGLSARIVLSAYRDTLWAPLESRLRNPSRFILMFAPISRRFSVPLPTENLHKVALPEYKLNELPLPSSPAVNMGLFQEWLEQPHGSSFDFDYHYMWAHYRDPGYYLIAKVLQEDCRNLEKLGMQGYNSCQNTRVFFPNGLGMDAMARTLWNKNLTFAEIEEDFFRSAYGIAGATAARDYFRSCSEIFHPPLLRNEAPLEKRQEVGRTLVAEFEKTAAAVQKNLADGVKLDIACQRESWLELELHIECNRKVAKLLEVLWLHGRKAAQPFYEDMVDWARRHEMRLQKVFDVFEFQIVFRGYVMRAPGLMD